MRSKSNNQTEEVQIWIKKNQVLRTSDGLRTDPENIGKIKNCSVLTDVIGVRKFMGLCNYYRKFIKDLSNLLKPLKQLLKKDVKFL